MVDFADDATIIWPAPGQLTVQRWIGRFTKSGRQKIFAELEARRARVLRTRDRRMLPPRGERSEMCLMQRCRAGVIAVALHPASVARAPNWDRTHHQ